MTCKASMMGGRRRSRSASRTRSRSMKRSRGRTRSAKRSRGRGRGRTRSRGMRGGGVATNATALALTSGSTSGTDYVGKLVGSMDTQWKNVFVNTGGNVPNGNLYELINGDTIPSIPTSMTGGQRGQRHGKNVTRRPHQQDWSSSSPLHPNVTDNREMRNKDKKKYPNVTDNRKMRKGKKGGARLSNPQ